MRTRALLFIVAVLAAAALGACGDGDEDVGNGESTVQPASVEEQAYYAALGTVMDEAAGELHDVSQALTAGFDPVNPEAERLAASQEYGVSYERAISARRDAIAALVPPGSLDGEHQALAEAADQGATLAEEIAAALAETPVPGSVELTDLFLEFDGSTVVQRFREACLGIQQRAVDSGEEIDLRCSQ